MKNPNVTLPINLVTDLSREAQLVKQALLDAGLETPMVQTGLDQQDKIHKLGALMTDVMNTLGLDLNDDSLADTPKRIAKMYVNEIFSGLDYHNFPSITLIDNKMQMEDTIQVSDIAVTSTCEHHFVTIDGIADIAYIPKQKVIGLSKINRIVNFFAQRPQVQERLTRQILIALQTLLGTDDVAVRISAVHYCVKARGIRDTGSTTNTSAYGGKFKKRKFRIELK